MSNEAIMPEQVSGFATVMPTYSVSAVKLNNGTTQRNLNWKNHLTRFAISGVYRTVDLEEQMIDQYTITELLYFWHDLTGPFETFRMKVGSDYFCPSSRGFLDDGLGTGKPNYQIKKAYSSINIKPIKRPKIDSNFAVLRNGVQVPISDTLAGGIQISDTGLITFNPDREINIASISLGVDPVVATSTAHGLTDGKYVYFHNLNNNSNLNHKAYAVTVVSSTVFKLVGVTNNFAVTVGKVQLYAQPNESLRWKGEFYYLCRFTDEYLDHTNAEGIYQLGTVNIEEVRT